MFTSLDYGKKLLLQNLSIQEQQKEMSINSNIINSTLKTKDNHRINKSFMLQKYRELEENFSKKFSIKNQNKWRLTVRLDRDKYELNTYFLDGSPHENYRIKDYD